jgi:trehalose-phosphatase
LKRALARLVARIARMPRPLLLAFDVDGTLAPIVDDPHAARVPAATARMLAALSRVPGVRVALVTGRGARSLSRVVRVEGAFRAVEHGRVVIAPGEPVRDTPIGARERARLDRFERWARAHAVPLGARLERKPQSRSVHVRAMARRAPDRARRVLAEATRVARAIGLVPRWGRGFTEAAIALADKGHAVATIAKNVGARAVLYAGDDMTDRTAIGRARALGGLGIFVRSSERPRAPRGASAVLSGPDEVTQLLGALVRALR